MPATTARFSRTLDQRNPHVRSSAAHIEPLGANEPMHPADRLVLLASSAAGACVLIKLALERLMP